MYVHDPGAGVSKPPLRMRPPRSRADVGRGVGIDEMVGIVVGASVGKGVGAGDGTSVGFAVGVCDIVGIGEFVGMGVGIDVGLAEITVTPSRRIVRSPLVHVLIKFRHATSPAAGDSKLSVYCEK